MEVVDLALESSSHSDPSLDHRVERLRLPVPTDTGDLSPTFHDSTDQTTTITTESQLVAYRLKDYPGCLILPNFVSQSLQLLFAHRALTQYCSSGGGGGGSPQTPHATNLSNNNQSHHNNGPVPISLWDEWKDHHQQQRPTNGPSSSSTSSSIPRLEKLSWSTMGYHYDWTNRSYPPPWNESSVSSMSSLWPQHYSPVPPELQRISSLLANTTRSYYQELTAVGTTNRPPDSQASSSSSSSSSDCHYQATACIVNYYHTKSVMGIHRDEIELALHQPVISISIGCSAIFLFGGTTLDADTDTDADTKSAGDYEPDPIQQRAPPPIIPILVRSGDVIIFGGPNRLNYHSMPRIIPLSFLHSNSPKMTSVVSTPPPPHPQQQLHIDQIFLDQNNDFISNNAEIAAVTEYLSNHRININIRQVY